MWRQFYEYVRYVLALKQQVEKNTEDIAELNRKVSDLTDAVQALTFELRRMSENETHEREKMMLRLENAFLKLERRLSSGSRDEGVDT